MLRIHQISILASICSKNSSLSVFSGNTYNKSTSKFRQQIKKLNNQSNFAHIINTEHNMKQTLKILRAIESGAAGITMYNFQSIFKKYVYYVTNTYNQDKFVNASTEQKIQFLKYTTNIYKLYGNISSNNLIKVFNKTSDQLLQLRKKQAQMSYLQKQLQIMICISRYNKNKGYALFKASQKRFSSILVLKTLDVKQSLLMLELMSSLSLYNRLIVETIIDVLYHELQYFRFSEINLITTTLGYSLYPINKKFVQKLARVITDISKGQQNLLQQSLPVIKEHINILSSLAQIQINMNLTSAYLPSLDQLFQVSIVSLAPTFKLMRDQHLKKVCDLIRRCSHFDQGIINLLLQQIVSRQVKQIQKLKIEQQPLLEDKSRNKKNMMVSVNTLFVALHMAAFHNFRKPQFMRYTVEIIDILNSAKLLSKVIKRKYFSRAIWGMCVLATKQQLIRCYPLVESYFNIMPNKQISQDISIKSVKFHEILNFYYCFLLLKTAKPQISNYFPIIEQSLISNNSNKQSDKKLSTKISLTHQQVYKYFLQQANIPCLKQFQISNLMCDIFIPRYISQRLKKSRIVQNVVIDVHGYHHFMRNCNRIKGGSHLKSRILQQEGYIYQYIPIDEWTIIKGKQYIIGLMDKITQKYGKQYEPNELQSHTKQTLKISQRSKNSKGRRVHRKLTEQKSDHNE